MPPAKKRASDADGKAQAKRRKKQKGDESDGSDIDGAGADFDNEPDETTTEDTAFVCAYFLYWLFHVGLSDMLSA